MPGTRPSTRWPSASTNRPPPTPPPRPPPPPALSRQHPTPPRHLSYGDRRERHKIHQAVYPADVRRENGGHLDLDSIDGEAADLVEKDPAQGERAFGNRPLAGAG